MKITAKKIKMTMMLIIVITCCALGINFVGHRFFSKPSQLVVSALKGKSADMIINNVNQEATKQGLKQWRLDAKTAKLFETENKLQLDELSVVFFIKNQKKVRLRARQGVLRTDTNDIQAEGNVQVQTDAYQVVTQGLHYDHNNRIITSPVPIKLSGEFFDLSADQMKIFLDKEVAQFNGKVNATIHGFQLN